MTETVSGTVAKREEPGSWAMIQQYRQDFATVLPSHLKAETWVRVAQGALKKGKKIQVGKPGNKVVMTELEHAARNNPGVFLASMLEAARLGLAPGSEEYYLTPRKVGGQMEILGIVGYQGYIELMYRAGAVASVVAEVVRVNDTFVWTPGRVDREDPPRWEGPMVQPYHEVNWFADRGELMGVYAYAPMKGGGTSKVIVLNRQQIAKIRAKSQGSNGEYSPWNTNEEAMWLKSAVRQLRKWVPTSTEYLYQGPVQVAAARADGVPEVQPTPPLQAESDYPEVAGYQGEEVYDGEVVDEDENGWPPVAPPGSGIRS